MEGWTSGSLRLSLVFCVPGLLMSAFVAWMRTFGPWTGLEPTLSELVMGVGHNNPALMLLGAVAYFTMIVWLAVVMIAWAVPLWARWLEPLPNWTWRAVLVVMLGLTVSAGPVSIVEAPFVLVFGQGKGAGQFVTTAGQEQSRMLVRAIRARGDINAHSGSRQSLLGWAVGNRDGIEFVSWLLDQGADPNARGSLGNTPLMTAIGNENVPAIGILLARGADATAKGPSGQSVLDYAVETGDQRIVELVRAAVK